MRNRSGGSDEEEVVVSFSLIVAGTGKTSVLRRPYLKWKGGQRRDLMRKS
jgi:hypothetical protein